MAKVSLVRCNDYDRRKVYDAVKKSVDLLGGIGAFVKPGAKVLVKPNLLSARPPEDAVDAHPEVVRAVVRLVKEAGGVPVIGDSPAGYGKEIDVVFEKSGIKAVAAEEGVELVRFTEARIVDGIPYTKYIFESDCIISIPKFKTHCVTILTAGVKNMYGAVVGLFKAQQHSKAPREADFAKIVTKVYAVAKPHLTIVDGIVAMEGDGPSGGRPRSVGLIMAGRDAVAVDACLARVMGLAPYDIMLLRRASQEGLGEADPAKIEISGDSIDGFITDGFKLPMTLPMMKIIPRAVINQLAKLIRFRPYIKDADCLRCNLCATICPVKAITIRREGCSIDYKKCVRCLCCHEVCPHKAIDLKRNIITRLMWG